MSSMKHPGPIIVSTDYASGFLALSKGNNKQLKKLQFIIVTCDVFNRIYNAVVDHAYRELENEIQG